MENVYDVIIIGGGPAGLTAALYSVRANLKTLILAGVLWGGQPMLTTIVENYPGFPEGITGPELMMRIREQVKKQGAEILDINYKYGVFDKKPFLLVTENEKKFFAKSVIIATGEETKWLGVPGEKEKIGRGISSCAPCDGAFYRGKKVIVVGGGDAAMEEAMVLTKFASHVWLVHRREELRASEIMQKRAFENKNITFIFNTEIEEVLGEQKVERVRLKSKIKNPKSKIKVKNENLDTESEPEDLGGKTIEKKKDKIIWEFPIDGVFVAIGHTPNTKLFKEFEKDEKGYIKNFGNSKTNIEGVFVAGDVFDSRYRQVITASSYGAMAALDVDRWLREQEIKE